MPSRSPSSGGATRCPSRPRSLTATILSNRPLLNTSRPLDEEPGMPGRAAGGGGRLGAMNHREHLAQAERFIAECQNRIARQREIITTAYENRLPTDIPESMLRALEESLRALEKHRQLILDKISDRERQR